MIGFVDARNAEFRPAVIEVLGGLFDSELAHVNRHLAGAPRVTLYDEQSVVTAFVRLTAMLVLEVRDDDATIHLELRRLSDDELLDAIRTEHAGESVIGPDPIGVPIDDAGAVLPAPRRR